MIKYWFIRHCDKTDDNTDVNCSEQGYKRAQDWATFFTDPKNTPNFTSSNVSIIASGYGDCHEKSQRMMETVQPLSIMLRVPIQNQYCVGQEDQVSNLILKQTTENVLVCWEHHNMISIMNQLLSSKNQLTAWPKEVDDAFNFLFMIQNSILYFDCIDFDLEGDKNQCTNIKNSSWLSNALPIVAQYDYGYGSSSNKIVYIVIGIVVLIVVILGIINLKKS